MRPAVVTDVPGASSCAARIATRGSSGSSKPRRWRRTSPETSSTPGRCAELAAHGGDDVLRDRGLEREHGATVAPIDRGAHRVLDHAVDGVDRDLAARRPPRADLAAQLAAQVLDERGHGLRR